MYNALFHRILACLNIFVVVILLIDSYWCPAPTVEIFDHDEVSEGYMPGNYGVSTGSRVTLYDLVSTSGERVMVPSNTDISIEPGDTFYLRKSRIFHQQATLIYPGYNYVKRSGVSNHWLPGQRN